MTNLNSMTATVDERLQIIRADKNFYEYIGFENFISLADNIHPEDLEPLKKIVAQLTFDAPIMLILRFLTIDKQYHHVLTELSKFSIEGEERNFIEIKSLDIDSLDEKLGSLHDENLIYDEYLDIWGECLFLYDKSKDYFQIYNGGSLNRVFSFRGTLDEFRETILRSRTCEKGTYFGL